MSSLTEQLKQYARSLGFTLTGIVRAEPGKRLAAYQAWVAQQYHGEMGYMARPDRVARRQNVSLILPGV